MQNLHVLFVGPSVSKISDELGFYYLGTKNQFWTLLEYAGITQDVVVTPAERKLLLDAQKDGVLSDMYKKLFFERKETALLKYRIGLTDLNRRKVAGNDDDPSAEPTSEDIRKFVRTVEKYKPKTIAFITKPELFEKYLKSINPSASQQRGKQDFLIGDSEVWLIGSTSGRVKDTDALEEVFEDLANRLKSFDKEIVPTTP
jgi:G:T/U-mismatch repair DNA glycosylase